MCGIVLLLLKIKGKGQKHLLCDIKDQSTEIRKKKNHEVDQSHKKLEMVLEGKCEDDFTECYSYLKYTTYKVALSAGIHKKE